MTDPAYAEIVVQETLLPYLAGSLPDCLGRELYLTIRRRLQAGRCPGDEHTDEVFQQTLLDALSYLRRHGGHGVRHTRGWLHRISLNATRHYLMARSHVDSPTVASSLEDLIEGNVQLPDNSSTSDDLARVRRAIARLRPRHQEVLRLELLKGLDSAEIQRCMGIRSNPYFRKLKCEALRALREEIRSSLYVG